MELYDIYAKGFVEGCGGALTDMEIVCLPIGAKVMTYECGMRFLTDYLSGDTYFKVDYPTHNLDRTRTQLKTGVGHGTENGSKCRRLPENIKIIKDRNRFINFD